MMGVSVSVTHCPACGGDGVDSAVKDETGKVAHGEVASPCWRCEGTGHLVEAHLVED